MSNAVAKIQPKHAYPAFAMEEKELIEVLRNSLYPGASDGSIKMVVSYCKASNLDPMQKPVHIVPIWDSKASTMRDVVMPGIGLYRSQASRSGEYAGVSEPEFGDDVTETFLEEVEYDKYQKSNKTREAVTVTYPKWCRVTVKRLLPNGAIVEFAAKELWKENYATASRNSKHPNAMWSRRPYAQLAKCAEAQALRKAFPEFGAQLTADEMEGREIDITPPASGITPNSSGAQAGQAAKSGRVIDSAAEEARANLIEELEASAKNGTDPFRAKFREIGKEGRVLVGADEYERLLKVAAEVDQLAAQQQSSDAAGQAPVEGQQ